MEAQPISSPTDEYPDVTVIVVSYNTAHLLDRLFAALAAARAALKLQVIVVDNASRDNSLEILRTHYPHVELIENRTNLGFGRANNQALPRARGMRLASSASAQQGQDRGREARPNLPTRRGRPRQPQQAMRP